MNKLYKSDFPSGPKTTKKQQILFGADVFFAQSEGYTHVQDSNGSTFKFVGEGELLEVESFEELLKEPKVAEIDTEENCAEIVFENIKAVDKKIRESLSRAILDSKDIDILVGLTVARRNLLVGIVC